LLSTRVSRAIAPFAVIASLAVVAAGCGSDDSGSSSSTGSAAADTGASTAEATTTAAPSGEKIKVGLVTDIGGLNDRSFNQLANEGLEQAEKELGIDGRVLTSKSDADYVPNLTSLCQQKYNLIIGVGFLMADAVEKVADKCPDAKFAIIDSSQATMKTKPQNVEGLLFKEQEAGYLAGIVAGNYAKDNGIKVVSSVGGQKIPPVDHYIAGFQAGAKAADPSIKVLNGYSQDFVDQSKCKEIALNQINEGSGVVFQVAGQCGLGALDAAKEQGKQGIGVDADQAYLGDFILTSAEKKVNTAVVDTVKAVQDGSYAAGDTVFDLKTDGVGIGKLNANGTKYQAEIDKAKAGILDGSITVPDTVK
jgi:basic membrane protein A and related proteins